MPIAAPFVAERFLLAESPYWSQHHGGLFWVDILGQKLCFSREGESPAEWCFDQKITSCNGATDGRLVVTLAKSVAVFEPQAGHLEELVAVEPELPGNRCNDAGVDPEGNFWFGTMDDTERQASGSLYCLLAGAREPIRLLSDIGISNTFAWDPDLRRMYFADSAKGELYALEFDWSHGEPVLRRRDVLLSTPEGVAPDGSCLSRRGQLFNARWGAGMVVVCSAAGEEIDTINVPANFVTSCCFGGASRDTLFVTSAAPPGLEGAGSYGGGVFRTKISGQSGPVQALFAPC